MRNLGSCRHVKCPEREIVTIDATHYAIPDDATVIFMFSPFWGDALTAVLNNILSSVKRVPRTLRLACLVQPGLPFDVQIRSANWLRLSEERTVGGSVLCLYHAVTSHAQ